MHRRRSGDQKEEVLLRTLLSLGAASFLFTALSAMAADVGKQDLPDTGTHTYRIPNAFLPGYAGLPGYHSVVFAKSYAAFSIGALYPDLQPAGTNLPEYKKLGWFNQVKVLVEHRLQVRPAEELITSDLSWAHLSRSEYTQDHDCKTYLTLPNRRDERECGVGPDIFILHCNIKGKFAVYPSCTEFANLTPDTTAIINYPRKFADNAVEIDRRLRDLIASFDVSEKVPPPKNSN